MKAIQFTHTCKCGHSFSGSFTPSTPDRISGPPDSWEQGTPAECEPGECPHCGAEIDLAKIEEELTEALYGPEREIPDYEDYE